MHLKNGKDYSRGRTGLGQKIVAYLASTTNGLFQTEFEGGSTKAQCKRNTSIVSCESYKATLAESENKQNMAPFNGLIGPCDPYLSMCNKVATEQKKKKRRTR